MRKKKYNPMKEVNKLTRTTVATGVGAIVPHMVVGAFPAGAAKTMASQAITTPTRMMTVIPTMQAGGSIIRSLDMLSPPKRKRRKR